MLELPEHEATGELATIYADIRQYSAVPYVSSLQRHVATMPGCLEYAWRICRPAFVSGELQRTAWALADTIPCDPFPRLSRAALELMGVDDAGLAAIRNICQNFIRVAPLNLLFAGVVERLLNGELPGGGGFPDQDWSAPAMLAPMPALRDMSSETPTTNAVFMQLATELGGRPFVPGLYRLLADWPAYLAHAATLIEPVLKSKQERERRTAIARRIVGAAQQILAGLPMPAAPPPAPSAEQAAAIISAIMTYRVTSPEMIVFGNLLERSLPEA